MKESIAAVNNKYQMPVQLAVSITTLKETLKKQKDGNKKNQDVKKKVDVSTVPQ